MCMLSTCHADAVFRFSSSFCSRTPFLWTLIRWSTVARVIVLSSFGGNEGHDPHILYTLSALQVMALLGELDRVDKDKV